MEVAWFLCGYVSPLQNGGKLSAVVNNILECVGIELVMGKKAKCHCELYL